MLFSIDRIIKGRAMLIGEDKKPLEVSLDMLPEGAKSGDMLFFTSSGKFVQAEEKAKERRQNVADMLGVLLHSKEEEGKE